MTMSGVPWTDNEMDITCYLYRRNDLSYDTKVQIAVSETGRTQSSIKMRFGNYLYVESKGQKGLSNCGRNVYETWSKFESSPKLMEQKVLSILKTNLIQQ